MTKINQKHRRQEKNSSYKRFSATFFIFLILTLTLISTVSAGIYKETSVLDKQTITIKDKYWIDVFGWFSDDVAELKLNTPLVNYVPIGYNKVAEYEVSSKKDLKILVSQMELYNIKDGMKPIERQIDYKVKTIEQGEVNDYESQVVGTSENWFSLSRGPL